MYYQRRLLLSASLLLLVCVFAGFFNDSVNADAHPDCSKAEIIGCFIDKKDSRDMPTIIEIKETNRPNVCAKRCKDATGITPMYFALQARDFCICADSYGRYGEADPLDCNLPCPGDPTVTCGGYLRNEVFYNPYFNNPNAYVCGCVDLTYKGCYADQFDPRDMGDIISHETLTNRPSFCAEKCQNHYEKRKLPVPKYMAVQAGAYCFCANAYGQVGTGDRLDESECGHRCTGDPDQKCGGDLRNSVYENPYHIDAQATICGEANLEPVGCFMDKPDRLERDMNQPLNLPGNYPRRCAVHCKVVYKNRPPKYIGVQQEYCSCANAYGRYGKISYSNCSSVCKGDESQKCGNRQMNQVFKNPYYIED